MVLSFPLSAFADDSSGDQDIQEDNSVIVQQLRVSPSDTSGLHSIILTLIGDYNPVSTDYTYQTTSYNGTVTTNHVVEITPDWSWILTCLIFIVVLYSLFRFVGGIFSGR